MKLSALLPALLLASCAKEVVHSDSPAAAKPVAVHTVGAVAEQWPQLYEATGTVRARTASTISSKVMGYVQQVHAKEGDHVSAGQLLISLEARDLDANYRHAELGRAEVETSIPEADYAVSGAKANLELAQATFKRMEDLARKNSVSRQEFDEASARLKAAQSNYEMMRSRRTQLDARLAQADQQIRAAGITRDYAKIAAPFAGTVTARSVDPGNLATPGALLLTIEQDGAYRLEASVDESRLASVRVGRSVEVTVDALDRRLTGRVSEIVPSVDAASRAYIVKIELPPLIELRSGMFGRACFPLAQRNVLTIPWAAVMERGQVQSVFVAENEMAHTRLVTLGQRAGDSVEVLSGLSDGERVVAPVPAGLVDGAAVEIRQ